MTRSKRVSSAAVLLLAAVTAHAVDTTYTFDSITAIRHLSTTTGLTGVLVNESAPTTITAPASSDALGTRCAKSYDLLLETPGIYTLSVTIRTTQSEGFPPGSPPLPPVSALFSCFLELKQ